MNVTRHAKASAARRLLVQELPIAGPALPVLLFPVG